MSQVLTRDTSTWSALNFGAQQLARRSARDTREADDFFAAYYFAGRTDYSVLTPGSAMILPFAPGAALGLMPPSAIKEREKKKRDYLDAIVAGAKLAVDMFAADEMDAPDFDLWKSAAIKMIPYVGTISAPLVHPLQLGGVSFEWHDAGLNIELRFRSELDIFVVIEDARSEIPEFLGKDPFLTNAVAALDALIRRQV
jgi:hypothetical protein